LKGILCLKHGMVPPQPHITTFNPELDLLSCRAVVPRRITALPARVSGQPRLVSVSSFGLSGTLANVILEEVEAKHSPAHTGTPELLLLSARSPADFKLAAKQYLSYAQSDEAMKANLAEVCRTTQIARDHLPYRRAWAVSSFKEAADALQTALDVAPSRATSGASVSVWFHIPHSHIPAATISNPIYAKHMMRLRTEGCTSALEGFGQQLALARTLEELGCRVAAVGGEGVAEYLAAAFAGAIDDRTLFSLLSSLIPSKGRVWAAHADSMTVEDCLLSYTAEEARIIGTQDEEVTYILTDADLDLSEIQEFVGEENLLEAHPLAYATLPSHFNLALRTPKVRIASAHLGDFVDDAMCKSAEYWRDVPQRTFDIAKAREVMQKTGAVVDMAPASSDSQDVEGTLYGILAKAFEAGCTLRWVEIAGSGPTCHLPTYTWAPDA
jgi:acyl transferase domain-containing protein